METRLVGRAQLYQQRRTGICEDPIQSHLLGRRGYREVEPTPRIFDACDVHRERTNGEGCAEAGTNREDV